MASLKQSKSADQAEATLEMASILHVTLRQWIRKLLSAPPRETTLRMELSSLGSIAVYCPGAPTEWRCEMFRLISALAWLYPGAGETAARRELVLLRNSVLEEAAQRCDRIRDGHLESRVYAEAIRLLKVSAPEKPPVQP